MKIEAPNVDHGPADPQRMPVPRLGGEQNVAGVGFAALDQVLQEQNQLLTGLTWSFTTRVRAISGRPWQQGGGGNAAVHAVRVSILPMTSNSFGVVSIVLRQVLCA